MTRSRRPLRSEAPRFAGQALKISKIVRFEVHAPEAEIEKLRGPMAARSPQFFVLEEGFRRSREA